MSVQFCLSIKDAKTKWCPFARVGSDFQNHAPNRVVKTNHADGTVRKLDIAMGSLCIASDCMAWRWVETHIQDRFGNLTIKSGDTHGFCGLAGIPSGAQH